MSASDNMVDNPYENLTEQESGQNEIMKSIRKESSSNAYNLDRSFCISNGEFYDGIFQALFEENDMSDKETRTSLTTSATVEVPKSNNDNDQSFADDLSSSPKTTCSMVTIKERLIKNKTNNFPPPPPDKFLDPIQRFPTVSFEVENSVIEVPNRTSETQTEIGNFYVQHCPKKGKRCDFDCQTVIGSILAIVSALCRWCSFFFLVFHMKSLIYITNFKIIKPEETAPIISISNLVPKENNFLLIFS